MYEFLKWNLGSPFFVAAQLATAGYQHFDKGYSDEAGASLLGFDLPGERSGSEFRLPIKMGKKVEGLLRKSGEAAASAYLLNLGIPPNVTRQIVGKILGAGIHFVSNLGFNMPKGWDIDNSVVLELKKLRTQTSSSIGTARGPSKRSPVSTKRPPLNRFPIFR